MDSHSPFSLARIEAAVEGYRFRTRGPGEVTHWAGVAAILREDADVGTQVLVIRRSEHPSDPWSGHMAMPGGRQDPGDPTVQDAAERETLEEVGLDLRERGRLLGRLDDVDAVARGRRLGLTIAPFVYAVEGEPVLTLNHEVQEAHWVPLRDLSGDGFRSTKTYQHGAARLLLPCWSWHGRVIWGLTYNMLDTLLRVIDAR